MNRNVRGDAGRVATDCHKLEQNVVVIKVFSK